MSFEHELIKGRIAETIFEMMFRETKKFTVLRFGYETTLPELAQYRHEVQLQKVIDQVSGSPDFVLVTKDKKQAYFVEVKYRSKLDSKQLLKIATESTKRWGESYLFLVTPDNFYFGPVHRICNEDGFIEKLSSRWVSTVIQNKYLGLVEEFLSHHTD